MTPRPKESERKKIASETRQRLLAAAGEEFAKEGYDGANINRISIVAGFAKGTIYNYFPSKRDLMFALIEESSKLHYDFIAERVLSEEDAVKRVERFFEGGFDFVRSHLYPGQVMVNNIYGSDAEFKEAMYQAYLPMFQLVAQDIIALGISKGSFRQVDPILTANLIMNIYLGTASPVSAEGKPWFEGGQVADFVLHALRTGS